MITEIKKPFVALCLSEEKQSFELFLVNPTNTSYASLLSLVVLPTGASEERDHGALRGQTDIFLEGGSLDVLENTAIKYVFEFILDEEIIEDSITWKFTMPKLSDLKKSADFKLELLPVLEMEGLVVGEMK